MGARPLMVICRIAMSAVLLAGMCSMTLSEAATLTEQTLAPKKPVTDTTTQQLTTTPAQTTNVTEKPVAEKSDGVERVTQVKVIREDMVIEQGETLYVKQGGRLFILPDVTLTVKGKLKSADGGEIYVKGDIDVEDSGQLFLSGKMKIMSTGVLSLGGSLCLNPTGEIKGLGNIDVKENFSDIICNGTIKSGIIPPKPVVKDGVTYVGGVLVANKQYHLPKTYGNGLDQTAYSQYIKMKNASGYDMTIVSGFRSYEKQEKVFNGWVAKDGFEAASRYSAQPGTSEHQTGLAMDITSLYQSYGETAEGKWLAKNCWKYGFIIRYPEGKEHITGYMYEPWHVRYLGRSTAKMVYDSGLTLEEFLGLYKE